MSSAFARVPPVKKASEMGEVIKEIQGGILLKVFPNSTTYELEEAFTVYTQLPCG